jgi:hypothetical protein
LRLAADSPGDDDDQRFGTEIQEHVRDALDSGVGGPPIYTAAGASIR